MRGIHTHYDNLKVSRNAHPKVIRAAYKNLSRQYHPDHNPNDPEATKVMQVINLAYDVLSDPVKRKEHDEWIARMEAERQEPPISSYEQYFKQAEQKGFHFRREEDVPFSRNTENRFKAEQPHRSSSTPSFDKKSIGEHIFKHWFWYVLTIATIIGFSYHSYSKNTYNPLAIALQQHKTHAKPANGKSIAVQDDNWAYSNAVKTVTSIAKEAQYVRPANAPDGNSWPATASYLNGFEQSNMNGMSGITIENNRKDSDVLVKLFTLEPEKPTAVRVFYIPAHETFRVESISPGLYDIRFIDLNNGQLFRTEPFELQESFLVNGMKYTGISIKLNHPESGQAPLQNLASENF